MVRKRQERKKTHKHKTCLRYYLAVFVNIIKWGTRTKPDYTVTCTWGHKRSSTNDIFIIFCVNKNSKRVLWKCLAYFLYVFFFLVLFSLVVNTFCFRFCSLKKYVSFWRAAMTPARMEQVYYFYIVCFSRFLKWCSMPHPTCHNRAWNGKRHTSCNTHHNNA